MKYENEMMWHDTAKEKWK